MLNDAANAHPRAHDFYLAEYGALRAELMDALQAKSQLLVYTIATFGGLTAFALANRMVVALLLYPAIAAVFFWRWYDAGATVGALGRYIGRIEARLLGDAEPPGWEHQMAAYVEKPAVNKEFWIVKIIFVGSAVLAIAAALLLPWTPDPTAKTPSLTLNGWVQDGIILVDVILTLVVVLVNAREYRIPGRRERNEAAHT